MPWCPICKNEYREGISECADCKVPLVESLDNIVEDADALLFSTENAALAEKFITYLDYSNIHTHDVKHDEENDESSHRKHFFAFTHIFYNCSVNKVQCQGGA